MKKTKYKYCRKINKSISFIFYLFISSKKIESIIYLSFFSQTLNIFIMSLTVEPQTVQCEISFIWAHFRQHMLCLQGRKMQFFYVILHIEHLSDFYFSVFLFVDVFWHSYVTLPPSLNCDPFSNKNLSLLTVSGESLNHVLFYKLKNYPLVVPRS